MSRTRYEWTLVDYAIWSAGAVTVPIYETSSAEQVEWILRDSGARAVVAEGPAHTARVASDVRPRRPEPRLVDRRTTRSTCCTARRGHPDDDLEAAPYDGHAGRPGHDHLHLGHHRTAQGLRAHPRQLHVRASASRSTSSHAAVRGRRRLDPALPAAGPRLRADHPGGLRQARASGWATPPTSSTWSTTSASSSRPSSWRCPASSRRSTTPPSSGPRPRARQDLRAGGRHGHRLLARPSTGQGAGLRLRARHALFSTGSSTASCARPSAAAVEYAVSGGAPLGDRLGHFYRGIGLVVLEGYGLTETTAALTANRPDAHQGRHGRSAAAGHRGADRRGRRAAVPGRPGLRGVLAATRRRRPRCSSATAGSTPATSARSTTRASCGSPAARRRSW